MIHSILLFSGTLLDISTTYRRDQEIDQFAEPVEADSLTGDRIL
jgi:hypothetical protein